MVIAITMHSLTYLTTRENISVYSMPCFCLEPLVTRHALSFLIDSSALRSVLNTHLVPIERRSLDNSATCKNLQRCVDSSYARMDLHQSTCSGPSYLETSQVLPVRCSYCIGTCTLESWRRSVMVSITDLEAKMDHAPVEVLRKMVTSNMIKDAEIPAKSTEPSVALVSSNPVR